MNEENTDTKPNHAATQGRTASTCSVGLSEPVHDLKILPQYFERVIAGEKTFEIRKDDRGYQRGDYLYLWEYDPNKHSIADYCYTGRTVKVRVSYLTSYEQKDGYVVMAILLPNVKDDQQRTANQK